MKADLYGLAVLAQRDWDGHMDIGDGWWVVMMVGMFLFWAAVAVAIVWGIRAFAADRRGQPESSGGDSALAILDRTLAEGKISVEDYERRRRVLTGQPPGESGRGEG